MNPTERAALRAKLFRKNGKPRAPLHITLTIRGCADLAELEALVKSKELGIRDICWIRGNGYPGQPGLLPQYLFGLPSAGRSKQIKIEDNFGAGI